MECRTHTGVEADLTCMECGREFCRECVKESGDSLYCPECHTRTVERLAAQMVAPRKKAGKEPKPPKPPKQPKVPKEPKEPKVPKPPKQKKQPEQPKAPKQPKQPEQQKQPEPEAADRSAREERRAARGEKKARRRSDRNVIPGLEEPGELPPLVILPPEEQIPEAVELEGAQREGPIEIEAPEVGEKTGKTSRKSLAKPAGKHSIRRAAKKRAPAEATEVGEVTPVAAEVSPAAPEVAPSLPESTKDAPELVPAAFEAAPVVPAVTPAATELTPAAPEVAGAAPEASASKAAPDETYVVAGSTPQAEEEFWDAEDKPRVRRVRRASRALSMRVPDEYEGELTEEPSYLKAVLWALLVGLVTGGLYGTIAWLRPRGVPGIFGWFIGFAAGITVVVASGRHFNWKLGLVAAGIALACLCLGYVLSNVLRFWFPRNALDIIIKTQSVWERLRLSFVNLKDQFPSNWWWLIFIITGLTAFLVSFRPWPFQLNTGEGRPDSEATR